MNDDVPLSWLEPGTLPAAGPTLAGTGIPAHCGGMDSGLLVWPTLVVLALCLAAWARYAMERNSLDEVRADIRRPAVLTGLLLILLVAVSIVSATE